VHRMPPPRPTTGVAAWEKPSKATGCVGSTIVTATCIRPLTTVRERRPSEGPLCGRRRRWPLGTRPGLRGNEFLLRPPLPRQVLTHDGAVHVIDLPEQVLDYVHRHAEAC